MSAPAWLVRWKAHPDQAPRPEEFRAVLAIMEQMGEAIEQVVAARNGGVWAYPWELRLQAAQHAYERGPVGDAPPPIATPSPELYAFDTTKKGYGRPPAA